MMAYPGKVTIVGLIAVAQWGIPVHYRERLALGDV